MKRVFFDITLILFVFLLPWWATVVLSIVGLFMFVNFYEFLISGVIIILLSTSSIINTHTFYSYLLLILFYFFIQFLRSRMLIYKNDI